MDFFAQCQSRIRLFLLLWCPLFLGAQTTPQSPFDIDLIRTRLPLAMDSAGIPGVSLAWLDEGKIQTEVFGYRNTETEALVGKETVFEAASLSKPVTAYLTLRLADRGRLHLDVPLIQFIPRDHLEKAFFRGKLPGEQFNMVTARMLLTHCAGFPNWRKRGKPIEILFEPGSRYQYSGEGFMLLQVALEYVSRRPLDRLARTYVFEPLDMDHTSFVYQDEVHTNLATGYGAEGKAFALHHYGEAAAAYSLLTTPEDYLRFMAALIAGKGLRNESHKDLLRAQRPVGYGAPGQYHWGLGIGLEKTAYGQAFWHWGDNGPFKCFMMGIPDQGKAFAYFSNSENGLAVGELILEQGFGVPTTTFDHLDYYQFNEAVFQLPRIFRINRNYPPAETLFRHFTQKKKAEDAFPETKLMRLGYRLLKEENPEAARIVLKLNLMAHPESWNAYDSLAEVYVQLGKKDQAIRYYRESLLRNPDNQNGKKMLLRLTGN